MVGISGIYERGQMLCQIIASTLLKFGKEIGRPIRAILERIVELAPKRFRGKLRERTIEVREVLTHRFSGEWIDAFARAARGRSLHAPSGPFDADTIDGAIRTCRRNPALVPG